MRLDKMLGIKYPFIQGGMANIATGEFAAAVSNAGGLGLIGAGGMNTDMLRENIRKCRTLTDKPFGVNLMLMNPEADAMAELLVEENVKIVTTGAESGGHVGEMTTMTIVPKVVDSVNITVIAAGGIADGRQLAAAFALGAAGVQMGTCLLASTECPIHDNYKQAILKAKDNDTIVTGRIAGTPVRVLKNEMSREYVKQEKAGADKMELEKYTLGSLRKAVFDGDTMNGSLMAGQVAGQIDKIQPIEKIFEQIYEEYEAVRKELYAD